MAEIDINDSWMSDHPLISAIDNDNNIRIGVFNVLSRTMSSFKENANKIHTKISDNRNSDQVFRSAKSEYDKLSGEPAKSEYDKLSGEPAKSEYDKLSGEPAKISKETTADEYYKLTFELLFNGDELVDPSNKKIETPEDASDKVKGVVNVIMMILNKTNDVSYSEEESVWKSIPDSKNLKKKKYHEALIDEIFKTSAWGGFNFTSTKKPPFTNLKNSEENVQTVINNKKVEFLIENIKKFFSAEGENPQVLVCPEFDYFTKDEEFEVYREVNVNKIIDELNEESIKFIKCGYYADEMSMNITPKGSLNPDLNFCRVIFYKNCNFLNNYIPYKYINYIENKQNPLMNDSVTKKETLRKDLLKKLDEEKKTIGENFLSTNE